MLRMFQGHSSTFTDTIFPSSLLSFPSLNLMTYPYIPEKKLGEKQELSVVEIVYLFPSLMWRSPGTIPHN